MSVAAIIAARMGSTRFPGKVLADLNGKPILQHVVEACQRSCVDQTIIATPYHADNMPIWKLCYELNLPCTNPNLLENDVLGRLLATAITHDVDVVIRANSDCPLLKYETIDKLLYEYDLTRKHYIGYRHADGTPAIQTSAGMPELITTMGLRRLQRHRDYMGEHVTFGAYTHATVSPHWIPLAPHSRHANNSVDTLEDLERIRCESRLMAAT